MHKYNLENENEENATMNVETVEITDKDNNEYKFCTVNFYYFN